MNLEDKGDSDMPLRLLTIVAALLLLPVSAPAGQGRPSPESVAKSLQQRYQGIRDFSADFVHTYRGGVLRTQTTERGRALDQEAGIDALGVHGAGEEGVRL